MFPWHNHPPVAENFLSEKLGPVQPAERAIANSPALQRREPWENEASAVGTIDEPPRVRQPPKRTITQSKDPYFIRHPRPFFRPTTTNLTAAVVTHFKEDSYQGMRGWPTLFAQTE